MTAFKIEKVANMIFISRDEQVWKAWHESEFTERKLQNAIKKIQAGYQEKQTFIRTF